MGTAVIITAVIAFAVSVAVAPAAIKVLRKMKFGQKILEDGPTWHMSKQNTPTIGGVIFIIGTAAAILFAFLSSENADMQPLIMLAAAVCFGAIGFVDDYTKVKKKRNKGLSAKQKLMLQIAVAILFVTVMRISGNLSPELYIPFLNMTMQLPWVVYMVIAVFIIIGADNAVNLTDGIDGLCTSVTFTVSLFFAIAAAYTQNGSLLVFAAALCGSLLAFYLFNKHPAKVFMGDTGSLFLGGAVCVMAFSLKMPLVLVLVGLIYIIETLSDIIQVVYFKATGGKRFFKMAPIHHHFEMCGWSEKKIVSIATAVTVIMCAIAYVAVTQRGVMW